MAQETKAAVYDAFGELDDIRTDTIELPEIKEGELLVRVKAAGVNPVDAGIVGGHLKGRIPHEFPIIPGWDMAGIVEERGFSARRFDPGDAVYAYARRPLIRWGTFTEYVVIPESYVAKKPDTISFEQAGAIPLAGLTAYQSIYDAGALDKGQTVAILGGSGGVGSFGIQLAKEIGARVIGVASEKNHAYMKDLGADVTIDYHDNDVGEVILDSEADGVDLLFDCTSGETLNQALKSVKKSGKVVSILNQGDEIAPEIDFQYVFVEPNSRELAHLRELVDQDKISVHVSETYTLEEAPKALKQIQSLHTKGKIVITP